MSYRAIVFDNGPWDWRKSQTADVAISDDTPINTGLLDARGNPLYRLPDKVPLGYAIPLRARV